MQHNTGEWSDLFDNKEDHDIEEDFDIVEVAQSEREEIDAPLNTLGDNEEFVDTGSIEEYKKERVSKVTGKTVSNYVDNDTFCNAIIEWNALNRKAIEEGRKTPTMPDVIGIQIEKIADGLSKRYNFRNYTYIDEMKSDAIYMACRAIKNFDPSKSTNAFGYFTFVMWRAMTTRIKAEQKEHETKLSMLKDPMYMGYTSDTADTNINKDRLLSVYDQN